MKQTNTDINSIILRFGKVIVMTVLGSLSMLSVWAITRVESIDVIKENQIELQIKIRDYNAVKEKVINCEKFHDSLGPVLLKIESSVAATREDVATIKGRLIERNSNGGS